MSLTKEEYREKECKTLGEYFEFYNYDSGDFDYARLFSDVNERSYNLGFDTIDDYRYKKEDEDGENQKRFSMAEFIALIGYATYCFERQEQPFIDEFINDMLKLDIPDELELLLPLAKYYDVLYFSSDEMVNRVKENIQKYISYNNESDRSFDKIKKVVDRVVYKKENTDLEQDNTLFEYSVFLNQQKDKCELYKRTQIKKLEDHLSQYQFPEISDYSRELRWILPRINYDTDYMLSNFPDIELVKKDYEALHGKSIVPYSISLYKDYLFNKDKLDEESNNLGTYNIHRVGEVPVPFTKEEFLLGIHSELDEERVIELEGKKNTSRIH